MTVPLPLLPLAPTARVVPSGLNATESAVLPLPVVLASRAADGRLHSVSVPPLLPAARVVPSGLNATDPTRVPVSAVRSWLIWRGWAGLLMSHSVTVPPSLALAPAARVVPSGLNATEYPKLPLPMVRGWLIWRRWAGSLRLHSVTVPTMPVSPPPRVPTARVFPSGLNASEYTPASLLMVRGWLIWRRWARLLRLHKVTVSALLVAATARVVPSGLNATESNTPLLPGMVGWLICRGWAGSLTFHKVTMLPPVRKGPAATARVLPSGLNVSEYTPLTLPMARGWLIWRGWAGLLMFHKMTAPMPLVPSSVVAAARVVPSGLNATESTVSLLLLMMRGWPSRRGPAGVPTLHSMTALSPSPTVARVLLFGLNATAPPRVSKVPPTFSAADSVSLSVPISRQARSWLCGSRW